jgi:hypothetical protein
LLGLATADNSTNYNGDNTSGIFIWGAQLEAGAFATSPIITTGAAGTRGGDLAGFLRSSTAAGTWVAWYNPSLFTGYRRIVGGPTGGSVVTPLLFDNSTNGKVQAYDGANVAITANNATLNVRNKAAMTYDGTNVSVCLNGGTVATGAGGASFPSQTQNYFGSASTLTATEAINGYIERVLFTPSLSSSAQLQALTAP